MAVTHGVTAILPRRIIMRINLQKYFFTEKETLIAEEGSLRATAYRFSTGVEALKIENEEGYFVILPFMGQQLWDFHFGGRDLKMKTSVKEPVPNVQYLQTYGGFLYHCGIQSFGAPDATHPQHGEIPNRAYDNAYLEVGTDEKGTYMAVGGTLHFDIAFVQKYDFSPETRLYAGASKVRVNVKLENKKASPMEYMYLCHINFRPFNGARLVYNVPRDAEHIKIHKIVPDTLPEETQKKLSAYMEKLEADRSLMDTVGNPDEIYIPEICFAMKYNPDENGRGYTMQYIEGEGACYVDHPVKELELPVRWISRTPDEDAMGMVLPATGEHLGYANAKAKGQIKMLAPYSSVEFYMEVGFITDAEAKTVEAKINKLI